MKQYRIPLIKPYINARVKELVNEVLDSGYLTEGPVTHRFEEKVAKYVNAAHGIAFTSCTTALETALRVAGIGVGDDVIIPDFTYPATAHAVQITGAVPVIVDVDPYTMLMDLDAAEAAISPVTKALMPVSLFGNPMEQERLQHLKEKYGLLIIEDAACALGSSYKGQLTGSISDMSAFSFHPRKFITTGEGGMVTTNNDKWAEALERYKHFGMGRQDEREELVFQEPGTNYKMSNLQAAVGLAQMEVIDDLLSERRRQAGQYDELFRTSEKIDLPLTTYRGEHSYQSYIVFVENRDEVMKKMRMDGIEVQIGTYALHLHPAFQDGYAKSRGQYPGSRRVYDRALALPLFYGMTDAEQMEVAEKLKKCVE